jgi:hypothetical protein
MAYEAMLMFASSWFLLVFMISPEIAGLAQGLLSL